MLYQIYFLNPEYQLAHDDDAELLFDSNDLGAALVKFQELWVQTKKDIGIYMPTNGGYADYHQNPRRDAMGRFI